MSYFITSISNAGGGSDQAYRKLQKAGASPEVNLAGKFKTMGPCLMHVSEKNVIVFISFFICTEIFKLEAPSLMVGTLDSLMVRPLLLQHFNHCVHFKVVFSN
jgi:hypothetical protein